MVIGYQNVPLQGFVCRDVLLARFAWTLLSRALIPFSMVANQRHMIWTRNECGKLITERKLQSQVRSLPMRLFSVLRTAQYKSQEAQAKR